MKKIFFIILAWIYPLALFAQPVITDVTGTFSQNESVAITVTGQGSKTHANPVFYADFEGGTKALDTSLSADDTSFRSASGLVIESSGEGDNNDYSVACTVLDSGCNTPYVGACTTTYDFGDYSYGFARRYSEGAVSGCTPSTTQSQQVKIWRAWEGCTSGTPTGYALYRYYGPCSGDEDRYNYGTDGPSEQESVFGCYEPPVNAWYIDEFELYQGTVGSSNGEIRWWQDGPLMGERTGYNFKDSGSSGDWGSFLFQFGASGWSPACKIWYDDIYIDDTWQRVIIGDAADCGDSSPTNCTHKEIQVPTAWSTTSITVTFKQGTFSNNDAVYLFVYDANGDASSGYELTIGQSIRSIQGTYTLSGGTVQ